MGLHLLMFHHYLLQWANHHLYLSTSKQLLVRIPVCSEGLSSATVVSAPFRNCIMTGPEKYRHHSSLLLPFYRAHYPVAQLAPHTSPPPPPTVMCMLLVHLFTFTLFLDTALWWYQELGQIHLGGGCTCMSTSSGGDPP